MKVKSLEVFKTFQNKTEKTIKFDSHLGDKNTEKLCDGHYAPNTRQKRY